MESASENSSNHTPLTGPIVARVPRKKAPRKSRSKGLRTKTGCITCRKRHKKCNEAQPICGNCALTDRTCIWPDQVIGEHIPQSEAIQDSTSRVVPAPAHEPGLEDAFKDCEADLNPKPLNSADSIHDSDRLDSPEELHNSSLSQYLATKITSPFTNNLSPSNTVGSEYLTADLASLRWLDLLAADAVQANRGFTRPSSPAFEEPEPFSNSLDESQISAHQEFPKAANDTELLPWKSYKDLVLRPVEVPIFRNFVERSSLWLDLFDPDNHFSVYTLRLALRNTGLMKAILALSAQHLSRQKPTNGSDNNDPNLAIQYYYEALHYVQTALQYNSYAYSEELLATALIISTYEMLDESDSGWQRHLKGVFWIQRSQDADGASGGIRQAVWWAWLRQDVWAAFKERRRCLSFWKPVKDYPELNQHEIIHRVTYLFSQAVNYCAEPTNITVQESVQQRLEAADELFAMLDRWKSFLGDDFKPLPTSTDLSSAFQPLWIHPPQLGEFSAIPEA
ncbi:hypothetical protein BP5796_11205 [Coleophoma crateriformis]|uniref:Zn(2)-C6 fungal-type domain-containing protein n=1 Tax=Coleophoma crateriformis TaxID=565419 RepID=A0A3D8QHJ1_9HELO|nr:hypothetical protein BP5796_11205 [Coleophoma crateriformis]